MTATKTKLRTFRIFEWWGNRESPWSVAPEVEAEDELQALVKWAAHGHNRHYLRTYVVGHLGDGRPYIETGGFWWRYVRVLRPPDHTYVAKAEDEEEVSE